MRFGWFISLLFAVPATAQDATVFAAASLAGPLDEIVEAFERETGHDIVLSYAGSSALARQVEAGAPADIVILANEAWMEHLLTTDTLRPESVQVLLSNRLVLIGSWHLTEPVALEDLPALLQGTRLSLALTEAVPAGIYARQALETLGLWEAVAPTAVEADNVRAAQTMVAIGAARFGIVYATDVAEERRVTVLADIPEDAHDPIRYPAALTQSASTSAETFYAYLRSPLAQATFSGAGFGVIPE